MLPFTVTEKQNHESTLNHMFTLCIAVMLKASCLLWEYLHKIQVNRDFFIDSSKRFLKRVLLHFGNKHGFIPVGNSINMKEYARIKIVLERMQRLYMNG